MVAMFQSDQEVISNPYSLVCFIKYEFLGIQDILGLPIV